jgi:hypothetical protein
VQPIRKTKLPITLEKLKEENKALYQIVITRLREGDIELSESTKHYMRATNGKKQIPSDTFYNTDPLKGMEIIRSKRHIKDLP